MCPVDYESIESQYEFDACRADVCKNGPPCVDNCPGYKCICPRPFTGKNFNEYRVDCHENSSPPTATCIDSTGRFYCQCPFNLTGDDSRRTIQVDYHLSFPESQASSAALSVPFRISGITTFTIPMWAQFSHRNEPGVFFTLYSVTLPRVRTNNDGQWHHIAIALEQGTLTLVTEGLIASKNEGFGTGRQLPEFQHTCPPGYTGPHSDQLQMDNMPPPEEYCPGNLWVDARNGFADVTWDEPRFTDNVCVVRVEKMRSHRPAGFCPLLTDPVGGTLVFKDWGFGGQFEVCKISC
ncbi:unnamed protein product [Bemisia tabaci]|uniref:Uncharacterized protein n=1 Tax=Bemisia tabaci TaxID=7038 RepID=A0A9P0AQE0_BEMTA|nr:unnamed protein product [Bemisia tabaci]